MPESQSTPVVGIVIPTHNRRDLLLRALECVRHFAGVDCRTVVVFDGCTDGSQEAVRSRFPEVVQVEGDGSLWWSGATNAGIVAARNLGVGYYLILNDDGEPPADMVVRLVEAAQANPRAIVGPIVFFRDRPNQIWCAGGMNNWLGRGPYMRGNERPYGPQWGEAAEVHWLPGMGTLIPAGVIERVGGMDTKWFPQYFGDADFCLRARSAGYRLLVAPDAQLYNEARVTGLLLPQGPVDWATVYRLLTHRRSHANWRTRLRFWARHCPWPLIPWQIIRFYGPLLVAIAKKMTWDRMLQPRVTKANPAI